ncbi:hypothetical protein HNV12_02395 [Methanococcoides sp. SA1]|nr:hypothetical protein [Methanococcoides sp. SA1]
MRKFEEGLIFWLGVYLFVLGVAAVMYSLANPEIASFLWLSYIGLVLIGFGMMRKMPRLIATQVCIILIPVLVWDVDFFVSVFGGNFLGLTNYFFEGSYTSVGKFISLQHLYTLPIAIWSLWKMGLKEGVWKWSFAELVVVWVVSYLDGGLVDNVNCVARDCMGVIPFGGVWYYLAWGFGMSGMAFVVNWGLVRLFGLEE